MTMPMGQGEITTDDGWGQNRLPARKLAGILAVILLHVVAVRVLVTGLAHRPAARPQPRHCHLSKRGS